MTKENEFERFLDSELELQESERARRMEQSDFKPFTAIVVGENVFEFKKMPPRDSKYADRKVFRVLKNGNEMDLTINKKGSLYGDVLKMLKEGKCNLKIVRVGTSREDTRYSVTEA